MELAAHPIVLLFVGSLICGAAAVSTGAASAEQQAIKGIVSGEAIQKVGFRAIIEKQAIMYNLAGYARNVPDGTVSVSPHGDKRQIDGVLNAMRAGTKKSSTGNKVSVTDVTLNPGLKTFTVFQWTSTTRNITNHMIWSSSCDQAMMRYRRSRLRACGTRSRKARAKGDDLAKFMRHLDADDQRRRRLPADPREDLA